MPPARGAAPLAPTPAPSPARQTPPRCEGRHTSTESAPRARPPPARSPRPRPAARNGPAPPPRGKTPPPTPGIYALDHAITAPHPDAVILGLGFATLVPQNGDRSEEHTSELQSRQYLVCRL